MTKGCSAGLEWSQGRQKFHKLTQGRRWRVRLPTKRRTLPLQRSKRPGARRSRYKEVEQSPSRRGAPLLRHGPADGLSPVPGHLLARDLPVFGEIPRLIGCRPKVRTRACAASVGYVPASGRWTSTFICSGQRPPRCAARAFSFVRGLLFAGVLSNLSSWTLKISATQCQPRSEVKRLDCRWPSLSGSAGCHLPGLEYLDLPADRSRPSLERPESAG